MRRGSGKAAYFSDWSTYAAFLPTLRTVSLATDVAFRVACVAAARFDSATETACLAALANVSYAVFEAATAFLISDTADSEPAGAFLAAKSTISAILRLPSAMRTSTIFAISALAADAMLYRLRL